MIAPLCFLDTSKPEAMNVDDEKKAGVQPLEITVLPQGEVKDPIPMITVMFSAPMISLGQSSDFTPATVSSSSGPVAGEWSWIDLQTLQFAPAKRLPLASTFTVKVPRGTRSIQGTHVTDSDFTATLSSARVTLTKIGPTGASASFGYNSLLNPDDDGVAQGGKPLDQTLSLMFSGVVETKDLCSMIQVEAKGRQYAMQILEETKPANGLSHEVVVGLPTGTRFPRGAKVSFAVQGKLAAAEGPEPVTLTGKGTFETYHELKVASCKFGCSRNVFEGNTELVTLKFNNTLSTQYKSDAEKMSLFEVRPRIENCNVYLQGATLQIYGQVCASTKYEVTVFAGLVDVYGQRTESNSVHSVTSGTLYVRQRPRMFSLGVSEGHEFVLLDPLAPSGDVGIHLNTMNIQRLKLRIHAVDHSMFAQFQLYKQYLQQLARHNLQVSSKLQNIPAAPARVDMPGKRVFENEIEVNRTAPFA